MDKCTYTDADRIVETKGYLAAPATDNRHTKHTTSYYSGPFGPVRHVPLCRPTSTVASQVWLTGVTLQWMHSFLIHSTQQVTYHGQLSATPPPLFGVPQGSVLYAAELSHMVKCHDTHLHQYADLPTLPILAEASRF